MRLATTAGIWGLALLGAIRSLRQGHRYPFHLLIGGVPFSLLTLQPYNGEMLLRVFLFSLPAVAFFAATLFYGAAPVSPSWPTTVLVGLASSAMVGGFLLARYGDERINTFTQSEYEAVQYVYNSSQPGAALVAVTRNLPWKFQDYEKYYHRTMTIEAQSGDIGAFVELMADDQYRGAYLILSHGQRVSAESYLGWSVHTWADFEQALLDSGDFERILASDEAQIFVLAAGCECEAARDVRQARKDE